MLMDLGLFRLAKGAMPDMASLEVYDVVLSSALIVP